MGLRTASTSKPPSPTASENSPIHQKNINVLITDHQLKTNKNTQLKDSKVFSNVSVQSNMAPALTEPLSSANKLSSSTTSISPRPTSNNHFNDNYSTTNINVDSFNLIDIEAELLRANNRSSSSSSSSFNNIGNSGGDGGNGASNNGRIISAIANGNKLKDINCDKNNINKFSKNKLAFQQAFEQVIAKQVANVDETLGFSSSSKKTNNISPENTDKTKIFQDKKPSKKLEFSRRNIPRQMGPMCDTNNDLTNSQLLEINSDIEYEILESSASCDDSVDQQLQEKQINEEIEESDKTQNKNIQYMDLSSFEDNDSQQDNTQVEIKSSSSTITVENTTDIEDNSIFPEDANVERVFETIVIRNEEMHRSRSNYNQENFDRLHKNSLDSASSQFLDQQQQQQQQQSQSQNQTVQVCSLTPQSVTSNSQKDLIKDAVEMDQVLGDMDILQVLKNLDSVQGGAENLCDLAGSFGFFNDDVMNYEEIGIPVKEFEVRRNELIRAEHLKILRKMEFLLRRLRKLHIKFMGRHASEEIAGLFEWTNRIVRRKNDENITRQIIYEEEKRRNVSTASMRSLLKKINDVATLQHSKMNDKNIKVVDGKQTVSFPNSSNVNQQQETSQIIGHFDEKTSEVIGHVAGMLQTELQEVQSGFDSDVTVSSSGGESADEMVTYNNPTQESLSISKRAAWQWSRNRAAIAARWTWLVTQISDLDHKILQHNELYNRIKKSKGAVMFEKVSNVTNSTLEGNVPSSVNGYRGSLPDSSKTFESESSTPNGAYESNNQLGACRTRSFQRSGFRKRKLLQTAYVHTISKKAARSSTIKCGCQWPLHPCALCTGRSDPMAPRDLPDTMTIKERDALLDPGLHPVLSFPEDVGSSIHVEAIARLPHWQNRVIRSPSKSILKGNLAGTTSTHKAADRREDRSNKKLVESRRKRSRKFAQDSGPANKIKTAKVRRALHGSQFNNNNIGHPHIKNNFKHRKLSSAAGSIEHQDSLSSGSLTKNSSLGIIGNSESISSDTNYNGGGSHHGTHRSKNSSPTPGNHNFIYRNERCERRNKNSYDIDNIVIPYSVAATTRVEILQYKEIPTPKWRIVDDDNEHSDQQQIELEANTQSEEIEEPEDLSDLAIRVRHERALTEERKKFSTYLKFPWSTRSRANRRIDSRTESSGANTPDPTSPASNTQIISGDHESIPSPANPPTPQTPGELADGSDCHPNLKDPIAALLNSTHRKGERRRTVSSKKEEQRRSSSPDTRDIIPPFEPLEFPLSEEQFESMLRMMPNDHQLLIEDCSKINCDSITLGDNINSISDTDCKKKGENLNLSVTMIKSDTNDLINEMNVNIMGCGSDTDSAESGIQDEDPNDPEWREPAK